MPDCWFAGAFFVSIRRDKWHALPKQCCSKHSTSAFENPPANASTIQRWAQLHSRVSPFQLIDCRAQLHHGQHSSFNTTGRNKRTRANKNTFQLQHVSKIICTCQQRNFHARILSRMCIHTPGYVLECAHTKVSTHVIYPGGVAGA